MLRFQRLRFLLTGTTILQKITTYGALSVTFYMVCKWQRTYWIGGKINKVDILPQLDHDVSTPHQILTFIEPMQENQVENPTQATSTPQPEFTKPRADESFGELIKRLISV